MRIRCTGCGVDSGRGGERNWQESSSSIRPPVPRLCLARTSSPQRSGPSAASAARSVLRTYLHMHVRTCGRPLSCRQSCELITGSYQAWRAQTGYLGQMYPVCRYQTTLRPRCVSRPFLASILFLRGTPTPGTYATATTVKFQERGIVAGQRSLVRLTWPHWSLERYRSGENEGFCWLITSNDITPTVKLPKPCSSVALSYGVSCCYECARWPLTHAFKKYV
jgi:hypothetical protein